MKKILKSFILALVTLALAFSLFACKTKEECKNHKDTNGDGLCEECGEKAEKQKDDKETEDDDEKATLSLIADGEVNFRIVKGADINSGTRLAIDDLVRTFKKMDIILEVVEDKESTIKDDDIIEVLVGTVESRGEKYKYDRYSLGLDGYVVKQLDDKIIIHGGQDSTLESAFIFFVEDILEIDSDTEEVTDVVMKDKDAVEEIQDDYDITSISIGGVDLKGYTIAFDTTDKNFAPFASELQSKLYSLAGYWLPKVTLDKATDKSIVLAMRPKDSTPEDSFRIYVKGETLFIESEYSNCVKEETALFLAKNIVNKTGDINFTGSIVKKDYSTVRYEDFKAKGDGRTNDFAAIKAAHDYANEGGQIVLGKATATYYISATGGESITIKTPTDWQGAKFIIDDTNLHETTAFKEITTSIMVVKPDTPMRKATETQLTRALADGMPGRSTTKIDLGINEPAMLNIVNNTHKVYVRYGGNQNTGSHQHEVVVVDAEGNIKEGTELFLDYENVSSIEIYSVSEDPIEIKNATFTTKASRVSTTEVIGGETVTYREYFKRNISVERSNTTVLNVTHLVEGEFTVEEQAQGLTGANYSGFFSAANASDVTFKDCHMTGRRYYKISGTYGFSATLVNNIKLDNCQQTNFYKKDGVTIATAGSEYWGLGGTNFCKNMIYDGCLATRFDAHAGLYRGQIINSHVGMVNLIGGGDFLIENSTIQDNEFISLRTDYGATWNGTITIKDSTLKNTFTDGRIVNMIWTNHDFGYVCHFPNLILDNVKHSNSNAFDLIVSTDTSDPNQDTLSSWGDYIHIAGEPRDEYAKEELFDVTNTTNINPLAPPEFIIVKNCDEGILFRMINVKFFEKTTIRGFDSYPDYDPNEVLPF